MTAAAHIAGASEPSDDLTLRGREQWYVAQTLHHREKIAELHLRAQGFRPFFPQFRKTVRHARKPRSWLPSFRVTSSSFSTRNEIAGILSTARWGFPGCCTRPETARTRSRQRCPNPYRSDRPVRLCGFRYKHRVGQTVRVVAGPFVGGRGVLERLDGKRRVRVLLNIMGGQMPLMIDRADFWRQPDLCLSAALAC